MVMGKLSGHGDYIKFSMQPPDDDDCTIEWTTMNGRISDIRITKGKAKPDTRWQRFRAWLHHRAPWLPSWITGWRKVRFERPVVPFPGGKGEE